MASPLSPTAGHTSLISEGLTKKQGAEQANKAASDATKETASGKKSGGYAGPEMAEQTRRVLKTEQHTIEGKSTQTKVKLLTGRITLAAGANQDLSKIAQKLHERVTSAQNTSSKDRNFPDFCKGLLREVEQTLNKKDFEGRSLFGGAATRSNAVNLSDALTPTAGASPDANYNSYFKGNDSKHTSTLNGEEMEYGFSALDEGAQDLIFWLKSGEVTNPDGIPGSDSSIRLQGMQDGLHKVTADLADTKKVIGEQLGNLERINNNNEDELAYNETTLAEITNADILEQLTKRTEAMMMQQLMMHLQKSSTDDLKNLMNSV